MSEGESSQVSHELLGEPHVRGRRISVRQIHALVEDRAVDPETVADRYDLDVADVYYALAYYHDHQSEMQTVESERSSRRADVEADIERPAGITADSA